MYKKIIDINNIESGRQYQIQSKSMSESTKIVFASQFLCGIYSIVIYAGNDFLELNFVPVLPPKDLSF